VSKRYQELVDVEVAPVAFTWRGRRYPVEGLLKRWRQAERLWEEDARSLECFRVQSGDGVYDLSLDRRGTSKLWNLMTVWD
jgi:hypothetical protein